LRRLDEATGMNRLVLLLVRWTLSAWVGAAVLFVAVGVREVTSPEFTSEIKDRLVLLRFPLFYATGFSLVGLAWVGLGWLALTNRDRRRIWGCGLVLVTLALGGMLADYLRIYRPLEALVDPPGQPRTQQFLVLHQWSSRVNTFNLAVSLAASLWLGWPWSERNPGAGGAVREPD
jgi:hypothetical protein